MDVRHKKKAIVGVMLWLAVIPVTLAVYGIFAALLPRSDYSGLSALVLGGFLVAQYAVYFWGGSHLAKAKGYNNAILLWGILCWLSQPIILAVLLFALPDKCASAPDRRRKKSRRRGESQISRIVRHRRNALVANVLGVAGILVSLALVYIRTGLFETAGNEKSAAILVFLPSYAAVIYGCWCWVKAKGWPDAVVFIGLMPLAPLMIPYFRILYVLTGVLPLLMVLMPVLLIGVVAALPDKSGIPKRKRWDRD